MKRLFPMLILAVTSALPQARWTEFRGDGIMVFSSAGTRQGRETLSTLEQFRHALGKIIGKDDLKPPLPIQVLLFKSEKDAAPYGRVGVFEPGKETISLLLVATAPMTPRLRRDFARLLLDANTDRMPEAIERGLITLFSTIEIAKTRIALGRPVSPAERNADWAKVHLMSVDPEYFGKLRVLLYNLEKGLDEDAAYRNAFGKGRAEIDAQAGRYLAQSSFSTVDVSARPIDPERDYPEREVSADTARDLLAGVAKENVLEAEYERLVKAADPASLRRAVEIRPRRAEPHFLLAIAEKDTTRRIEQLKAVAALDRRQTRYWKALAETYQVDHQWGEAAKAWRAAEQASTTHEQRARMQRARLDIDRQRLDWEEAERKRIAAEKEREIRLLKEREIAELRAIEERYNKDKSQRDPNEKVVPWWDGPAADGKLSGTLKQVDCLGKRARLVIVGEDLKPVKLLVPDPSRIAVVGANEFSLGCGPQKPRRVVIEYFRKADAKLGTAGEVASIQFP